MVFETVTASAFGSLVDRTLILAPGMAGSILTLHLSSHSPQLLLQLA
jgi:hypothetical protein